MAECQKHRGFQCHKQGHLNEMERMEAAPTRLPSLKGFHSLISATWKIAFSSARLYICSQVHVLRIFFWDEMKRWKEVCWGLDGNEERGNDIFIARFFADPMICWIHEIHEHDDQLSSIILLIINIIVVFLSFLLFLSWFRWSLGHYLKQARGWNTLPVHMTCTAWRTTNSQRKRRNLRKTPQWKSVLLVSGRTTVILVGRELLKPFLWCIILDILMFCSSKLGIHSANCGWICHASHLISEVHLSWWWLTLSSDVGFHVVTNLNHLGLAGSVDLVNQMLSVWRESLIRDLWTWSQLTGVYVRPHSVITHTTEHTHAKKGKRKVCLH